MRLGSILRRPLGICAFATILLASTLLSACTTTAAAVVIHYTAYYFPQFNVPSANLCTPLNPTVWYLYVNIDQIDNSASGAADFTFDPTKLQPLYPQRDSEQTAWALDLDPYWQPQQITVPAGQNFGGPTPNNVIPQVHQGKFFQINYGTTIPDTTLPDIPPILYHSSTTLSPILVPNPHHVFPGSAQPNQSQAQISDRAIVEAGPCAP